MGECDPRTAHARSPARSLGFGQRFVPGPLELHDLGPMNEATARERNHLRLLLTPAGERLGPLPCSAQLVRLVAALDRAAIDDAR